MSAILLSNTKNNENTSLLEAIKQQLGESKRIAYFPTKSDPERKYFNDVQEFFKKIGDYELVYFGLYEEEWNDNFINEIQSCDALYLSGGNTYNLLYHIKLRELENLIADFYRNKVIIGTSAGGIVLTPRIDISEVSNDLNLTDFEGLNLLDFYFYPHYDNSQERKDKLIDYKRKNSLDKDLYAVDEYSGIVVDDEIHFIGEVWKF